MAISEMLRVVKPNDTIVLIVPINKFSKKSLQRAIINALGNFENLLPEDYLKNPIGDRKSQITLDYGKYFNDQLFK